MGTRKAKTVKKKVQDRAMPCIFCRKIAKRGVFLVSLEANDVTGKTEDFWVHKKCLPRA